MTLRKRVDELKAVKIRYEAAYASYYDSVGAERIEALNNFLDCQRQLGTMAPDLIEYALHLEQLLDRAIMGLEEIRKESMNTEDYAFHLGMVNRDASMLLKELRKALGDTNGG